MRTLSLICLALLAACDPAADGAVDSASFAVDVAPPPTPGGLTLSAPTMVAGGRATFDVSGAVPGEPVYLLLGRGGVGAGPCHPAIGGCIDLLTPVYLVGTRVAGAGGNARFNVNVPLAAGGASVHVQAAARSATSRPLARFVERASVCGPGIPTSDCYTSYTVSGGWTCLSGESCQDVYDLTVPSGTQLRIHHENLTGTSVSRMALFAPGSPLSGTNLLWGSAWDVSCFGQDQDQTLGTSTLSAGTYRLAIGRDWGRSAGASGTYDLWLEVLAGAVAVEQTVDDEDSQAMGWTCLF